MLFASKESSVWFLCCCRGGDCHLGLLVMMLFQSTATVRDKQLHSFYRFYLFKDDCYLRRKDSILTWELYIQQCKKRSLMICLYQLNSPASSPMTSFEDQFGRIPGIMSLSSSSGAPNLDCKTSAIPCPPTDFLLSFKTMVLLQWS